MNSLNIITQILAYGGVPATNNPPTQFVNWTRALQGLAIIDAGSQALQVASGNEVTVFNNTISPPSSFNSSSAFTASLSPLNPSRYRFTLTAGTGALRTDRSLTMNTNVITTVVALNSTMSFTITSGSGGDFSAVQVGDSLFLPGPATGDGSSPFSPLNQGFWVVIAASSSALTLVRPVGVSFVGVNETVTITANSQVDAFSAVGIQAGQSANINSTSTFPASFLQTYVILAVTPLWFEVLSTIPLAGVTGIVSTTGLVFFSSAPTFLYVEVDQNVTIQINGDATGVNVVPSQSGVPTAPGIYMVTGPVWELTIINNSLVTLNSTVITAG